MFQGPTSLTGGLIRPLLRVMTTLRAPFLATYLSLRFLCGRATSYLVKPMYWVANTWHLTPGPLEDPRPRTVTVSCAARSLPSANLALTQDSRSDLRFAGNKPSTVAFVPAMISLTFSS